MKQKRWILMEVPEDAVEAKVEFFDEKAQIIYGEFSDSSKMHGAVELVQEVCRVAGVVWRRPLEGEWYYSPSSDGWHKSNVDFTSKSYMVIPVEPEPCPNCQNAKSRRDVRAEQINTGPWKCYRCNRPESEWTYVKEPEWAGIGSGIM